MDSRNRLPILELNQFDCCVSSPFVVRIVHDVGYQIGTCYEYIYGLILMPHAAMSFSEQCHLLEWNQSALDWLAAKSTKNNIGPTWNFVYPLPPRVKPRVSKDQPSGWYAKAAFQYVKTSVRSSIKNSLVTVATANVGIGISDAM